MLWRDEMEDVIKTEERLDYLVGKIFGKFWRKGFRVVMLKLGLDEFKSVIRFGIAKALSRFDMTRLKGGNLDGYLIWMGYFCTISELRSMGVVWRPDQRTMPRPHFVNEADGGIPIEDVVGNRKIARRLAIDVNRMLDCLSRDEANLLRAYYFDGMQQKELAKKAGVGRAAICARIKALRKKICETWRGRELEFLSWDAA